MKSIFTILAAFLLAAVCVSAQNSNAFEKGYRGNVSLTGNVGINKGLINNAVELTTSHGYNFSDGMYIGGGIGVNASFHEYVGIPVFLDMKYNIIDWKLSPYIDFRIGMEMLCGDNNELSFMASPGLGFDYRMMSFRIGYKCNGGEYFKLHTISIGTAVNF